MYLTAAARPSLPTPARLDHFACQLTGQDWPEEEEEEGRRSRLSLDRSTRLKSLFYPLNPTTTRPFFLPLSFPPTRWTIVIDTFCTGRRQKV